MTERHPDLYELLGVTTAATPAEINYAFRTRLRALHPDTRAASEGATGDADAELRHVLAAYVELRRRHHERDRASKHRESVPQPPDFRAGPVRQEF